MPETITGISSDSLNNTAVESADSVIESADSTLIEPVNPFDKQVCVHDDAPESIALAGNYFTIGRPDYTYGLRGEPRPMLPGYDNGVMCLLLGAFLILAANFRHYSTFLKTFTQDLWKVRNRSNVFDDHTMSETRVLMSMVILLCVSEGTILYSAIAIAIPGVPIFPVVGICTLLAMVYYIVQILTYQTIGYAFTTGENTIQWIKGYRASQSLLGIALVGPAVIVIFNPGATTAVCIISLSLYVVARLIFILKGFRIFFTNCFSLIYFILYLCSVELLPPFIICKLALQLSKLF